MFSALIDNIFGKFVERVFLTDSRYSYGYQILFSPTFLYWYEVDLMKGPLKTNDKKLV
jgi:hypothetical protein